MCVRLWLLARYTPVIGLTLLLMACSSAENTQVGLSDASSDTQQVVDSTKGGVGSPALPLSIVMEPKSGIYESTLQINFEHEANVSIYYAFNSKEDFSNFTVPGITKHDGKEIEIKNQHGVINAVAIDSSGARSYVLSVPFKYLNPDEEIWLEDLFDWPGLTEEEKNKKALMDWIFTYLTYYGENREAMLETTLLALRIRGERVIPTIEQIERHLTPFQEDIRRTLVISLSEIAKELSVTTQPEMKAGRQQIHELFLKMLQNPDILLTQADLTGQDPSRVLGVVEKDGQFFQTHQTSKLAIIDALQNIGDDLAKQLLESVAKDPGQYPESLTQAAVESLKDLIPLPKEVTGD